MVSSGPAETAYQEKDGQRWRIGTQANVEWISAQTQPGLTITSAIPPIFEAYATVLVPDEDHERAAQDRLLLTQLSELSSDHVWWLGYLERHSDSDVVFPDAPRTWCYHDSWSYVFVEAGPAQAASWRDPRIEWTHGALPDVIFPRDKSWLISRLWDDDWRCFGGPTAFVQRLLGSSKLLARTVGLGDDATPPGQVAR